MKKVLLSALAALVGPFDNGGFAQTISSEAPSSREVTLQHVLDLTLAKSFKIALADEQFESAARAFRNAKRRRLPRVGIQGWFSGDLFKTDEWDDSNLGGYLTLDWDFYQDGAIMQMIAQSWANLQSAAFTRRQTVLDLIYNAVSLFYDALKAKRQLEIVKQTSTLDDLQLRIARSDFDRGRKTQSELGEAEAKAFESQLSVTRAKQDLDKTMLNLRQLTRDNAIETVADVPRDIAWTLDVSMNDALRTGLQRQPNVLIAKANLKLAVVGEKYSQLKRWPSVRFLTGTDYAFAPMATPDEFGFRVGVILSYPLYDAGDRKSRIEDAKSAVWRARIQVSQAEDQMKQEVTDAYTAVSNQLTLLQIAEKRHEKVKTDFSIAQGQYDQGNLNELEMARLRLQYLQSLQRIESLRLDALLARAKLLKNVGVSSIDEIKAFCEKSSEEEQ
jgi:outer membrane protein TolC